MRHARGNAQKTVLLLVIAVAILGVAGVVGYKNMGERWAMDAHQKTLNSGNDWRQKVSMILNRSPEKFNTVTIQVGPAEWTEKAKISAEVSGKVPTQAALDELKKVIADNACPIPVEINVTVAGK